MIVAFVVFDGFTDVDLFLPWDLVNRVKDKGYGAYEGDWRAIICGVSTEVRSCTGVAIHTHAPLSAVREADAVFVVSGPGVHDAMEDVQFLNEVKCDPARQLIAAIDSGVLILARLGLLAGLSATTYPSVFSHLEALGVRVEKRPFVVHGNIATGGGCLATQDLAAWLIGRLIGEAYGQQVLASIAKVDADCEPPAPA